MTIYLANYMKEDLFPALKNFSRWRYFRFENFHEAMHLLMSEDGEHKELYLKAVTESGIENSKELILKSALDLGTEISEWLEDARIENVGLKTYLGYVPEQVFVNAVTFDPYQKRHNDKTVHSDFDKILSELKAGIIFKSSLDLKLDPRIQKTIDEFVVRSHQIETMKEKYDLCFEIVLWLVSNNPSEANQYQQSESTGKNERPVRLEAVLRDTDEISGEGLEEKLTAIKMSESDKAEAKKGSKSLQKEYENLQVEIKNEAGKPDEGMKALQGLNGSAGHSNPDSNQAEAIIPTVESEKWSDLTNPVVYLISDLKNRLKQWKARWIESLDTEGDELDTEQHIIDVISKERWSNKTRKYYDESYTSPKGKIAILVDASGSVHPYQDSYNRAAAIIAEGLAYVNAQFELYYFGSRPLNIVYLIKSYKEPWGIEQKERLANMIARGGTPLHNSLLFIRERLRKEGIRRLVILTDGNPSSVPLSTNAVSSLGKDGVRVAFIGIEKAMLKQMLEMTGHQSYNKVKYCQSLDEVPKVFFDIIQNL